MITVTGQNKQMSALYTVKAQASKQQGFTLLELMIAIFLSLLLTGVVIQSYLSNKQTYNLTEGVSKTQESIRFGSHFISTDIRMAGNLGCIVNVRDMLDRTNTNSVYDMYDLTKPIIGWDFAGTAVDDGTFDLSSTTGTRAWENDESIPLPIPPANITYGSDVLMIKRIVPTSISLSTSGTDNLRDSLELTTIQDHGFVDGSVLLAGDCLAADLFQVNTFTNTTLNIAPLTATEPIITPGNAWTTATPAPNDPWGNNWNNGSSKLYEVVNEIYYVSNGANGQPSLFRTTYSPRRDASGAILPNTAVELVSGIETLQVFYGIDDADTNGDSIIDDDDKDNIPNYFVSADKVSDWSRVVTVRFSLLAKAPDTHGEIEATTYEMLSKLNITPRDDSALHYVVNSTVKPRNKVLNVPVTVNICQANTIDPAATINCDSIRL